MSCGQLNFIVNHRLELAVKDAYDFEPVIKDIQESMDVHTDGIKIWTKAN